MNVIPNAPCVIPSVVKGSGSGSLRLGESNVRRGEPCVRPGEPESPKTVTLSVAKGPPAKPVRASGRLAWHATTIDLRSMRFAQGFLASSE